MTNPLLTPLCMVFFILSITGCSTQAASHPSLLYTHPNNYKNSRNLPPLQVPSHVHSISLASEYVIASPSTGNEKTLPKVDVTPPDY